MKLNRLITLSFLVIFSLTLGVGCKKKVDTLAVIVVKNNANALVAGANVLLKAEGTTTTPNSINTDVFPMSATSDSGGKATFNFNETYQVGQAGVAVLTIEVVAGSKTGQGVIKVEQEQTTEEVVFVI
ncbi:MAG: hypothetical protein P8N52_08605 [Crocinitomicaceae bacterium]|nr:hypothetical protein [Crocinitomicaceae bacterium]MDG1776782.1 hypothetical protein [Crocinitomicaceae bacterium]